jgi:Fic family protein
MNPPYQITPEIIKLIASISEKTGQINAKFLDKPSPKLRKENRIKTINSSLSIKGNTLTEEQIPEIILADNVVYRNKKLPYCSRYTIYNGLQKSGFFG